MIELKTPRRYCSGAKVDAEAGDDDGGGDDNADDEHDSDNAEAEVGPAGRDQPFKKNELYKAYKNKGPHKMFCDIMSTDNLRAVACMIVAVTRPLHKQYVSDLKAQQDLDTILQWNVPKHHLLTCLSCSFLSVKTQVDEMYFFEPLPNTFEFYTGPLKIK